MRCAVTYEDFINGANKTCKRKCMFFNICSLAASMKKDGGDPDVSNQGDSRRIPPSC
jgi:hypothetical protein